MKCRIPFNMELIRRQIEEGQQQACTRTQYFMFLAFNKALGIGPQRFVRVLEEYANVLAWYEEAKKDGVEEEKLLRAVQSIGMPINTLYGGE